MQTRPRLYTIVLLWVSLVACKVGSLFGNDDEKSKAGTASTQGGIGVVAPGEGAKPPGRSPVPTLTEWNGASEVTVRGSSALGCSTKTVREWLRISCSGKNDSGGTPANVVVDRGGNRTELFTFASGGVSSLVMPFVEGTDVEATFSWTDKSHKFQSRWPRGAPKPNVFGEFLGARTPTTPACVDCASDGDKQRAKSQGKECCTAKACRSRGECPGATQCCTNGGPNSGGSCRSECDIANSSPVCSTDADCKPLPRAFGGGKTTCKQHLAGVKACQQ